jgi:hypothetical protein
MDREDFIITVYCIVCDRYKEIIDAQRLRERGFAPALSDEEAITIDICGSTLGLTGMKPFMTTSEVTTPTTSHTSEKEPASCDKRRACGR